MKTSKKFVPLTLALPLLFLFACGGGSDGGGGTAADGGSSHQSGVDKPGLTVGGTLSGLQTGTQITLANNGANPTVLGTNGNFQFTQPLSLNSSHAVTVITQPSGQTCTVSNGTGTAITRNITDVRVICSIETYTISGAISGLATGAQITLVNNAADPQTFLSDGPFTLTVPVAYNSGYAMRVNTQPLDQTCTISNATGNSVVANIDNVGVVCSTNQVSFTPASLNRIVTVGTSVNAVVKIHPNFTPTGIFTVVASSSAGIFSPAVTTKNNNDGTYTLSLSTSNSSEEGNYVGSVTLNFCIDVLCTQPQNVPSLIVPFNIKIMSSTTSWPGNNLTALRAWPGVADWSMYQYNAAHTGHVPVNVDPNQFSTRWETRQNAQGTVFSSAYPLDNALTTENSHFFSSGNAVLYANNEFDGSPAWQYSFSALPHSYANPPSVLNGNVYLMVGAQQNTYLYVFNSADGSVISQSPASSQWEAYLAPTISATGVYTNGGSNQGLYGFSEIGAQLFYSLTSQRADLWTPAVDSAGVYSYTGALNVVDPVTGALIKSISDPTFINYLHAISGAPVLGASGSVIVANYANSTVYGNYLTDFNTSTNTVEWQIFGFYPNTPAYHAGVIYAVNNAPLRFEARSELDGSLIWSWPTPVKTDTRFVSEVLLTNNLAFVSTDSSVYAIDLTTHETVWSYPISGRLALSKNGILYLQASNFLVAINLK